MTHIYCTTWKKRLHLLIKPVKSNKKIAIYGDYDADGVTSVAVL